MGVETRACRILAISFNHKLIKKICVHIALEEVGVKKNCQKLGLRVPHDAFEIQLNKVYHLNGLMDIWVLRVLKPGGSA